MAMYASVCGGVPKQKAAPQAASTSGRADKRARSRQLERGREAQQGACRGYRAMWKKTCNIKPRYREEPVGLGF